MRIRNFTSYVSCQNKSDGFSMLEVLVTVLILSFGLLGMAALITTGIRSNHIANYRSIATQQTLNIADRMRANLAGVRAGAYDGLDATIPVEQDCVADNCSETEMATYDHFQWNTANAQLLSGGSGTVTGTLATGFVISVSWTENGVGGAVTKSFTTRFSP